MAWCTPAISLSKHEWQITAMSGLDWAVLVLLISGAAAMLIWTWRSLDPSHSPRSRISITGLRALALVLGFAILLRPTLHLRKLKAAPSKLAVLVDVTGSMTRGGEASRLHSAKRLIHKAKDAFAELGKKYQIIWYEFTDDLLAVKSRSQIGEKRRPSTKTDMAAAMISLLEVAKETPMDGVVVISDGADTEIGTTAQGTWQMDFLKELPWPINTVLVGDTANQPDLAIMDIEAPPFAFTRSETPITVSVSSVGLKDRELPAFLKQDGSVLQRRTLKMVGREGQVRFNLMPTALGEQVFEVSLPVPDGDTVPENNRRHVSFEVIRDKIRVLHLAGRPSWDQRFLRETLKSWPNVDLVSFYVLRTAYQSATEGSAGMALIPFPTDDLFKEHLQEFDILIFHEFEPVAVGVDTYSEKIAEFVKGGGALVLIAGEVGLKSGIMGGKGLEEILPVELLPPGTPANRLSDAAPFKPKLTENGVSHPITRFYVDEEKSKEAWRSITRLDGIGRAAGITEGAQILVEHPVLRAEDGPAPLIAIREVEKGRAMAITTDALWRWRFTGPMGGGPADIYTSFWKKAVAWLTDAPELRRLRLAVTPSPTTLGQRAGIDVELLDSAYRPVQGEAVTLTISWVGKDGRERRETIEAKVDAKGKYRADWSPKAEGAHVITAESKSALKNRQSFLVVTNDREIYHLEPKPSLLEDMARRTGGYFSEDSIMPGKFATRPSGGRDVLTQLAYSLWDHPIAILLFMVTVAAEWILRRRLGLR
jgi:hypothetical protein